ncbi:MAG: hypothetical protein ACLP7F_09655 [Acidimicrobiales bacterium]
MVTCNVTRWTSSSITFRSFGPAYGEYREGHGHELLNWVVTPGDRVVVQVWNANLPTSASWCALTVAAGSAPGSGTICSSVLVAGDPVISGGGTSRYPGTDHFGPDHKLLPSPLGAGQCQYQEFIDDSYQAQIALADASCAAADAVGTGAFQSRGAAFHAAGFACTATGAGAGSEWASAWTGTYYIYDCRAGAAQVAFNWGPRYGYSGSGGRGTGASSGGSSSSSGSGGGAVTSGGGGGSPSSGTDHYGPGHALRPSPLGDGQCTYQEFVDQSYQAQIAVYGANCTQADAVGIGAYKAKGRAYSADGFACQAAAEGAGSERASAWTGTYYAYDCKDGTVQLAFNWGPRYGYSGSGGSATGGSSGGGSSGGGSGSGVGVVTSGGGGGSPSSGTDHYGPDHKLLPSPLGEGQCEYQEFIGGSYQAQIAVYGANCTQADAVGISAYKAKGTAYSADGFACQATVEGAGSEWASAWTGNYYAYDCKDGTVQVAFNCGPHY